MEKGGNKAELHNKDKSFDDVKEGLNGFLGYHHKEYRLRFRSAISFGPKHRLPHPQLAACRRV